MNPSFTSMRNSNAVPRVPVIRYDTVATHAGEQVLVVGVLPAPLRAAVGASEKPRHDRVGVIDRETDRGVHQDRRGSETRPHGRGARRPGSPRERLSPLVSGTRRNPPTPHPPAIVARRPPVYCACAADVSGASPVAPVPPATGIRVSSRHFSSLIHRFAGGGSFLGRHPVRSLVVDEAGALHGAIEPCLVRTRRRGPRACLSACARGSRTCAPGYRRSDGCRGRSYNAPTAASGSRTKSR